MSVLYMVRHGQASLHSDDYDQLSPKGVEQSRQLGLHWAGQKVLFDQVYFGPRRRHRQTMEAVEKVYKEHHLRWPEPKPLETLDEHFGQHVMLRALPEMMKSDPAVRELVARFKEGDRAQLRQYLHLFQKVTRSWVRGELPMPDLEAWHQFRARIHGALDEIMAAGGGNKKILAFTSGGPIAASMGRALDIDDEKTLELSYIVRNATCAEFLFSQKRFSVLTFNSVPHLEDADLVTYI